MKESPPGKAIETAPGFEASECQPAEQTTPEQVDGRQFDSAREVFYQSLLASGLILEIKRGAVRDAAERPLVRIQGKPLSETLVEERR